MKAYSLILIIICYICRYAPTEIKPELKKNILNFHYGINYKYEGMLAHSFNRFYVVTKFILPTVKDFKFSMINFDDKCNYLQEENGHNTEAKQYISDLIDIAERKYHLYIITGNKFLHLIVQHIIL